MKGVMYTLEAVIAAIIILMGVVSILPIQESRTSLSNVGYSCIKYLDVKGSLRTYVASNLSSDLNNSLRNCLPSTLGFNLKVCSSADCTAALPSDKEIYASSYMVAGADNRLLNVWMWTK